MNNLLRLAPIGALAFLLATTTEASAQSCASGLQIAVPGADMATGCVLPNTDCDSGLALAGQLCLDVVADSECPSGLRIAQDSGSPMAGQCLVWTSADGAQYTETQQIADVIIAGGDPSPNPDGPGDGTIPDLPDHLIAACEDGADNDGDGAADYPADDGCASPKDDQEETEDGETNTMPVVLQIDEELMETNREYCERAGATEDIGRMQTVFRYIASNNGMEATLGQGDFRKAYSRSESHPADQEWGGIIDFSSGWGENMGLTVTVQCNLGGETDLRGDLPQGLLDGSDDFRLHIASPEMIVWESSKVRGEIVDLHYGSEAGYSDATAVFLTPGLHYVVTIEASSNAGGHAWRTMTPEGWRRVAAGVGIPVQNFPPAIGLVSNGTGL